MNNWISVEDRLPEIGECATVLQKGCLPFDAYFVNTSNWWTTKGGEGFVFTDITHWAPLAPKEPELDGWISVKEALPAADSKCLGSDGRGVWVVMFGTNVRHTIERCQVTHWQPLPDPPKPAGPFHTYPLFGDPAAWRLGHSDLGSISTLPGEQTANDLRDKLNELWAKNKGSDKE